MSFLLDIQGSHWHETIDLKLTLLPVTKNLCPGAPTPLELLILPIAKPPITNEARGWLVHGLGGNLCLVDRQTWRPLVLSFLKTYERLLKNMIDYCE